MVWLFTSYGIIDEISVVDLSQTVLDVILMALIKLNTENDYCLEYGLNKEKENSLILGYLLCSKLASSKSFQRSFRGTTPREIAAAYAFSIAETLLNNYKSIPESSISVALVRAMYSVKRIPSTNKYAAAFAFEMSHLLLMYDTLTWDELKEKANLAANAMLSALPNDKGEVSSYKAGVSHLQQSKCKEIFVQYMNDHLLSSDVFNKTFQGDLLNVQYFDIAKTFAETMNIITEDMVEANRAYALFYYLAFRSFQNRNPVTYATAISSLIYEELSELNVVLHGNTSRSVEYITDSMKVAKYNISAQVFAHSLSNTTSIQLTKNFSYIKSTIWIATEVSNVLMRCISQFGKKTKEKEVRYRNPDQLLESQVKKSLNSKNNIVDLASDLDELTPSLGGVFNYTTEADRLVILKQLHDNEELLSLTPNGLLNFNTKRTEEMRIEELKIERTKVLFYQLLSLNLDTSRAFQRKTFLDLKQVELQDLIFALSKYTINIPDFASISEQHMIRTYNTSIYSIVDEIDSRKFGKELSLTVTNILSYYGLLTPKKLVTQAALASIAINNALFYVLAKLDSKYSLTAVDKMRPNKIISIKPLYNPKEKKGIGSEDIIFNGILFSGLSSSRTFSKVFNKDLTSDTASDCFPQLIKYLSRRSVSSFDSIFCNE
ncbi:hypothetical protein JTE90_010432 [Oedothorax gibbosus]|uniref:Uncharacterized protein n=1 Tax=Oedothorax gibbosus TaxID=931172 RepID=A0AAV6W561_9ARAC|nr:hypothetical protein JTE90_010432 [Oedothorax gibbosus]